MNLPTARYRSTLTRTPLRPMARQYPQLGCRAQSDISDNLACPDYVLPEIAYKAFQELRWNIHAPDEVIMAAILAAMSSACQWWIRVKPPHVNKPHVVGLAIYTGADTGSGKSPVMDKVFEPMRLISLACVAKHKRNEKECNDDRLLFRAKRRALLAQVTKLYGRGIKADPDELAQAEQMVRELTDDEHSDRKPIYMLKGDISAVKLLDELHGTHVPILLATDEGRKFFGKMSDYDMEMHNQLWEGATVPYERMYRTVIAREPLVTYCVMTHLDRLGRFIRSKGREARGSGWLGRGLFSKAPPRGRDLAPAVLHPTWPEVDIFNARSMALLEGREELPADDSFEPITLEFDEASTMVFMEMLRTNKQRMASRDDWGLVQDFGRKHPSNVARIAAILHYFSEQPGTLISEDTLMKAIRIADWYIEQAKQVLVAEPMQIKLKKLVSFLHDKCYIHRKHVNYADHGEKELIPLRWVMQFHNIEREELDPLLDILTQEGAIELHFSHLGKRCVWLNPTLFDTL